MRICVALIRDKVWSLESCSVLIGDETSGFHYRLSSKWIVDVFDCVMGRGTRTHVCHQSLSSMDCEDREFESTT